MQKPQTHALQWYLCHSKNVCCMTSCLLGHGLSLQVLFSVSGPWQSEPLYWGGVHALERCCVPGPQVTEQLLHSLQFPHTPSTVEGNYAKVTFKVCNLFLVC